MEHLQIPLELISNDFVKLWRFAVRSMGWYYLLINKELDVLNVTKQQILERLLE